MNEIVNSYYNSKVLSHGGKESQIIELVYGFLNNPQ